MAKKPANLLYGVDDQPPIGICLILAIQHIFFLTGGLILVTIAWANRVAIPFSSAMWSPCP